MRHKSGWLEALKKPVRPLKTSLYEALNVPQYHAHVPLPTQYVPVSDETPLVAAFRVADEFMARYNAEHPAEFLYKPSSVTKVLNK